LLRLFGAQQGGVAGSPTLVAPTLVNAPDVQLPLVTGIDIAPEQASFAGWAKIAVALNAKIIYR
jgi:hypothetical protein